MSSDGMLREPARSRTSVLVTLSCHLICSRRRRQRKWNALTSPITETHGSNMSKWGFQRRKRTLESRLHARERRGKNAQPLRVFPQGTSATPATETATPGSGHVVIQDPAQIPSANHRLFETRIPLMAIIQRLTPKK